MAGGRRITREEARLIGERLGVDWDRVDPAELRRGIEVELEHAGGAAAIAAAADDELLAIGRVAWLRLLEVPDFYTRLDEFAAAAEKHRTRRFRI